MKPIYYDDEMCGFAYNFDEDVLFQEEIHREVRDYHFKELNSYLTVKEKLE